MKLNSIDDVAFYCNINRSSIIPESESGVFWYRVYWQVPLTYGMPFLFHWQLHVSKAAAVTMAHQSPSVNTSGVLALGRRHVFCQQSNPDVHIAPGNQMWTSVTVFCSKKDPLYSHPSLGAAVALIYSTVNKKMSVRKRKKNRLRAEYKIISQYL